VLLAGLCLQGSLAAASPSATSAAVSPPRQKLERVVMLSRHGVRAPTLTPAEERRLTERPWPSWPVGAGELTPHGERGEKLLGGYFHARYAAYGLLPSGCPRADVVSVWADNADQRTRASGQALLEGMFPGCGLRVGYAPLDAPDPLFRPVEAGLCTLDVAAAERSVLNRVHGNLDGLGPRYERALHAAAGLLENPGLLQAHNTLSAGSRELRLSGPLPLVATAVEVFLLEYEEGLPEPQVGWGGAASVDRLRVLMPAHEVYSEVMRKDPYLAARNASLLARRILKSLRSPQRVTVLMGHDSNISNLAGLLGMRWGLPGQPDSTPPGGTVAFEVWRAAGGAKLVRTVFLYQTPEQLRTLQPLDLAHPAGSIALHIPGCADRNEGVCTLTKLGARLQSAAAHCPLH